MNHLKVLLLVVMALRYCLIVMADGQSQEVDNKLTYFLTNRNIANLEYSWTNPTQWLTYFANSSDSCLTILLIHGWRDNVSETRLNLIVKEFDKLFACHNIVLVNWSGAEDLNYFEACLNAIDAAARISDFLFHLSRYQHLVAVHCIGHSLGAHICGMVGRTVHEQIDWQSITGLDPAGPGFTNFPDLYNQFALNAHDAPFVTILHTNDGCSGTAIQLGHADFYANGGTYQPGCGINCACSHLRSVELFAESIRTRFTAISYQTNEITYATTLGFPLSIRTTPPGKYYFNTNSNYPYRLN